MKTLPNGNKALYREGGVWSLIGGLCLLACMIIAYFAIPFVPGERWIYCFMAAPFAVMVIMLLKNFFKPTAVFVVSPQGIEFHAMNKLFGNPVKVFWDQLTAIYYDRRRTGAKYHATIELLMFKVGKDTTYEFNLFAISPENQERLYRIFREHHLKVTAPPVTNRALQQAKSLPHGTSNMKVWEDEYVFFRKGLIWHLVGAIVLIVLIVVGYFFLVKEESARLAYFFMTLPGWVFVLMLGQDFFRPVPALILSGAEIVFQSTQPIGNQSAQIKWKDVVAVHREAQNLGADGGVQLVLVFILQDETSYTVSLKGIVQTDYDKIVAICEEHGLKVRES